MVIEVHRFLCDKLRVRIYTLWLILSAQLNKFYFIINVIFLPPPAVPVVDLVRSEFTKLSLYFSYRFIF